MARKTSYKKLLIISCSNRKKKAQGKTKAFNLYDGVVFRMIKKLEREKIFPNNLEILILSAHYGLIEWHKNVALYDRVMTHKRTREIKEKVRKQLMGALKRTKPEEIFCCLGKNYWKSIEEPLGKLQIPIRVAQGRIGEKLSETKQWILRRNGSLEARQTYV